MKTSLGVLITGSSKGIGLKTAQKLHQEGHKIFITGRNQGNLQKIACVGFLAGDLLQTGFAEQLIAQAEHKLAGIDVLVNNAGIYHWGQIDQTPNSIIQETFDLNLKIPYLLSKLVIPYFKQRSFGRIINIASISGIVGEANASLYSASKAGLSGMSKALALELAEFNITVNCINPGWVKTTLAENTFEEAELMAMIPQKRWIEPLEIAELVNYLISPAAAGITGQNLNLCAGLSLG